MDIKEELAKKAETKISASPKLTASMSIADLIKALEPEIKKALPAVITPERFTRMALTAISTTPKLQECSQMSFIAALMNAAQLGLEPNTPLGQAYLLPYRNKGKLECQFQIGYKGMIDLVYRNKQVQTIQAQIVYEKDVIKTCWTDSWLMENLWKLYLKEEFLTVATWEGIEELLELYATRKRRLHAE